MFLQLTFDVFFEQNNLFHINEAKQLCKKIGYPILIKASGGGGGKGMKIVHKEEEFESLFLTAKSEAQKYFGNDEVYIEKFFQNPRHIEVQILAGKNRVVHLYERDCSCLLYTSPSPRDLSTSRMPSSA